MTKPNTSIREPELKQGPVLWSKAKKLIPGGNQLLSKRAEMFLPEKWPSYYKKAKGVEIWDLDDQRYIDMSIMGIGTCVLGYANDAVDDAVKQAITEGTMTTLNSPEEVELAEKLISLHPWAERARFSRTGGEACSMAVRIGRAASGKDKVAFCGYHGWHDWYLSSNLADDDNLEGHLLPHLRPVGVPKALKNTSFPFHYGNAKELEKIVEVNANEIGVIILEVQRYKQVDTDFLVKVLKIGKKIGAVVIFDEVTSGFRIRPGGIHINYNLEPDMVVLGKGMGNGYPISAVLGTERVMEAVQDTFVSSTYWTERIGFTAALEVIRQFEKQHVADHLEEVGQHLIEGLKNIFESLSLNIEVLGIPAAPILKFREENPMVVKTIFTQEMLKRGYLAGNVIYLSLAHTTGIIDDYLTNAREVFEQISEAKNKGVLEPLLEGPVCHSDFRRLA